MLDLEKVDILTILAIIIGPVFAVQLTRTLDDRKERRGRKLFIYRTLMSTRATTLSPAHVQALNSIDLEFSGKNKREKDVRTAWKIYLDHLGDKIMPQEQWGVKRVDLFVELLEKMGFCLGYSFDKVHIKNGIYSPSEHGRREEEDRVVRQAIIELLAGHRSLPIRLEQPSSN